MVAGMANVSAQLSPELHGYMAAHGSSPNEVTRDLIAETRHLLPERAQVQIPAEQAAFLTVLTRRAGYELERSSFGDRQRISPRRGPGELAPR
jgi:hypothetical protein